MGEILPGRLAICPPRPRLVLARTLVTWPIVLKAIGALRVEVIRKLYESSTLTAY